MIDKFFTLPPLENVLKGQVKHIDLVYFLRKKKKKR
jgi:hypothetical protein